MNHELDYEITLGIFGGSFDPPHKGHIRLCKEFSKKINSNNSKILVMPAKISPFKRERLVCASDKDRVEMCKLAFSSIENVEICEYELQNNEVSYTYKTIEHFLNINPDEKICICVGADCLETLECWVNAEYLFKNCIFAAAYRYKDSDRSFGEAMEKLRIKYNARIIPLYYDPLEISSTDIRNNLKSDDVSSEAFLSDCLDEKVFSYIKQKELYGGEL